MPDVTLDSRRLPAWLHTWHQAPPDSPTALLRPPSPYHELCAELAFRPWLSVVLIEKADSRANLEHRLDDLKDRFLSGNLSRIVYERLRDGILHAESGRLDIHLLVHATDTFREWLKPVRQYVNKHDGKLDVKFFPDLDANSYCLTFVYTGPAALDAFCLEALDRLREIPI